MDLEMPTEIECLLCGDETTLEENRAGNPFIYCDTFDASVNMRPGSRERPTQILSEAVVDTADDDKTLGEEDEEQDDEMTAADLFNTNDES